MVLPPQPAGGYYPYDPRAALRSSTTAWKPVSVPGSDSSKTTLLETGAGCPTRSRPTAPLTNFNRPYYCEQQRRYRRPTIHAGVLDRTQHFRLPRRRGLGRKRHDRRELGRVHVRLECFQPRSARSEPSCGCDEHHDHAGNDEHAGVPCGQRLALFVDVHRSAEQRILRLIVRRQYCDLRESSVWDRSSRVDRRHRSPMQNLRWQLSALPGRRGNRRRGDFRLAAHASNLACLRA